MATIWDDKNHSSGEQFIISKSASKKIQDAFSIASQPYTKISEGEYKKSKKQETLMLTDKESNNDIIFYFSSKNVSYMVRAKHNISNSSFTWSSAGTSTNRAKMTEIKELASLHMILSKQNNSKYLTEEELISLVKKDVKDVMDYWKPVYFTSAIAHSDTVKKMGMKGKIIGERQGGSISGDIYSIGKKLTSKAPDNWNPSDIWLMSVSSKDKVSSIVADMKVEMSVSSKDKVSSIVADMKVEMRKSLDNSVLAAKFKTLLDQLFHSSELVGVSLKQVDKGSAVFDTITYDSIKKKSKTMDFGVNSIIIRDTKSGLPAYGELKTKSGFNIKWGGRANASKANINIEGQMNGTTHQLGAIDAKAIGKLVKIKGMTIYKDSDFNINTQTKTIKMLKPIMKYAKEYFKNMTPEQAYANYGFVEVKRYIANVSVYEFVKSLSEDEILYLFLLAKKIDTVNPDYFLLH